MGEDTIPTVADNVETVETQTMESNAPAGSDTITDLTDGGQTTIPNPLAEKPAENAGNPADQSDPKNLNDVMFGSIGEKAPEEVDNRTEFEKSIPEEFKDQGFVKKYSSMDGLLKAHKAALDKLGERPEELDFANATDEQLNSFYERMRPEDASGYEFREGTSDEEKSAIGNIFHEAGLHPKQGKQVMEKYNAYVEDMYKQQYSEEQFNKSMAVAVGENYSKKLPEIQKSISDAMGGQVVQFIDKLPSNLRAAFYGYANKMNESFGATETAMNASNSDMGSVNWEKRASDAMSALRELERNPNHKQADKDALVKQYKEAKINQAKMKGNR